jgi:hypothetical protein
MQSQSRNGGVEAVTARPSSNFSPRSAGKRVRAVGAFVPGLTRKSFEKYGFSTATLLTDWTIIAGPELAGYTLPERLKWPRNVDAYEDVDVSQKGRPGATLVLRVDGPRAIEVQYQTAQIIERINAHFGYRAVADVRFIQAPLPQRNNDCAIKEARPIADRDRPSTTGAPEARLAAALARLEANISRERDTRRNDACG